MDAVAAKPQQMSIEALLTAWKQETAERKRRINRSFPVGMFIALAPLCALSVAMILGRWNVHPYPFLLQIGGISLVSTCIGMNIIYAAKRYTPKQQALAQALFTIDDLRAVGPLIVALTAMTEIPKEQIVATLMRLLPRMQAGDAALLTAKQRHAMYQILVKKSLPVDYRQHAAFRITLLKALEQIGDSAAIPYVETVAKIKGQVDHQIAVRDAALACLPFLLQRAEQATVGKALLRASGDPAVDHLLKPAVGVHANDAQELLRPVLKSSVS